MMKHVMTINRASPQFNQYLDLAITIALSKGAMLNVTMFKQEARRIRLIYEGGILKTTHVFFDDKTTPESVVNTCNSDIRIIQAKEQEA
ncbi:hypothetical protein BGI35_08380 [Snodgrassella communis]|jgi:hypothetical protein|nr:hypothetical protein BGI35_08380 [Snodgrassella communis]